MPLEVIDKERSALKLLGQVRDVMRSAESAQDRLDKLVICIAEGLHLEVCSIYFAQGGEQLELYATQGLNQLAVHETTLRYGEGLVGEIASIAAALNLPEAESHPKFAYCPETGEEKYHAFVGVPILYHHKVIGVLVVQSIDSRIFSDEEVETLQTIAMVLAEMAIGSQVVRLEDVTGRDDAHKGSHYFNGLKVAPGLAKAEAVLHRPRIEITQLITDNPSF